MEDWKAVLKADPTQWLLEEEDPSVRYLALKDLLGRPEGDGEVQSARLEIMRSGPVPELLQKMCEPSYAQAYPGFYTRKYGGLSWSLIMLAELCAQAGPQIKEQCEYILDHAQERTDGGFAMHTAAKTGGGRLSEVIPCLTGNMVFSLIRLGCLDDPRVQKAIAWLVKFMRFNDGVEIEPQDPPYDRYEMCWGKHTCLMGVVKALKAFAAIPAEKRTPGVEATLQKAAEFLLIHHIHKRSHQLNRVSKPGWLKFGFPLMYQTDALEILDILTGLSIRDSRMEESIQAVVGKQGEDGKWKAENTYNNDRLLIPFSEAAQSKWLTLRAMRVLKRYFESGG